MKVEYVWTADDLRLMGVHYPGREKTAVLFIHGMAGNIVENYFAPELGKQLAAEGIGFIYAHNRGYSLINDVTCLPRKKDGGYSYKRIGTAFERFEDCLVDIDAWIQAATKLGYNKVILMGHSLGCNKVIYYIHKRLQQSQHIGLVLLSPPDLPAVTELYDANLYYDQMKEAKKLVKEGKAETFVSSKLWGWCYISAQTYLDLFEQGGSADNLPVKYSPEQSRQLEAITVPALALAGEFDDIKVSNLNEDLETIKKLARNCPQFDIHILPKANHNYENQEKALTTFLVQWIKQVIQ